VSSTVKGVNPATLAKVGKAVTQLVGPNASPAQYKQLANEVSLCLEKTEHLVSEQEHRYVLSLE